MHRVQSEVVDVLGKVTDFCINSSLAINIVPSRGCAIKSEVLVLGSSRPSL